jgi:hypothetical protein
MRLEAKCSWATETWPAAQRSPRSRRYGNSTSRMIVSTEKFVRAMSMTALAPSPSNASRRAVSRPKISSRSGMA